MAITTLTVLGAGGMVASPELRNSNFLLKVENARSSHAVLLDCGIYAIQSLAVVREEVADIDEVFISHLHPDHFGGLGQFAMIRKFMRQGKEKPLLLLPDSLHENLVDGLMSQVASENGTGAEDFFRMLRLNPGYPRQLLGGASLSIFRTEHCNVQPSFGMRIETSEGIRVLISGDTKFTRDVLMKHYEWADVILHECQLFGEPIVHTGYSQLVALPMEIRQKMWLYHYENNFWPDHRDATVDGFCGFLCPGQRLAFTHSRLYLTNPGLG